MPKYDVDKLELVGADLADGETTRQVLCPSCNGGRTKERSFLLRRFNNKLSGNCYRASCGYFWGKNFQGNFNKKAIKKPVKYPETRPLSEKQSSWLVKKFGDYPELNEFQYIPFYKSVYMPVYNHLKYVIGYVDRSYKGRIPKSYCHVESDKPKLSFYYPLHGVTDTIVLTEDIISAIACVNNSINTCAALLGAHLSKNSALHLRELGYTKLVLFLDPDEAGKRAAIKIRSSYSSLFKEISILRGKADPKDMKKLELLEVLN